MKTHESEGQSNIKHFGMAGNNDLIEGTRGMGSQSAAFDGTSFMDGGPFLPDITVAFKLLVPMSCLV